MLVISIVHHHQEHISHPATSNNQQAANNQLITAQPQSYAIRFYINVSMLWIAHETSPAECISLPSAEHVGWDMSMVPLVDEYEEWHSIVSNNF